MLLFALALAVLAVAACAAGTPAPTSPQGSGAPNAATAPNVYNPYADDPLDPNLNPHYMRHSPGR